MEAMKAKTREADLAVAEATEAECQRIASQHGRLVTEARERVVANGRDRQSDAPIVRRRAARDQVGVLEALATAGEDLGAANTALDAARARVASLRRPPLDAELDRALRAVIALFD